MGIYATRWRQRGTNARMFSVKLTAIGERHGFVSFVLEGKGKVCELLLDDGIDTERIYHSLEEMMSHKPA